MPRSVRVALIAVAWLAVLPAVSYAQASITGVVRDTSGAVLPGVTVEVASPALIEKVRSVVTDDAGQYRVENLRPGTYTVTITLPGFSTVRRDGVELTGSFTALVNADMRVGAVEETITVTGESPVVDVQNTARQQVLDADIINALPSGRNAATLAGFLPHDTGRLTVGDREVRFSSPAEAVDLGIGYLPRERRTARCGVLPPLLPGRPSSEGDPRLR